MIRWLLRRKIRAFERQFDYDMSYARDILNVDLGAMWYLSVIANAANYRKELPLDAWYAAKISAARFGDCGACTQLVVSMAEQEGIAADNLRAILAEEDQAMTPDAALGSRFARSVLSRNVVEADTLRGEVLRRWGKRGLGSLALGIASSIVFPHLKYALGYGRSCTEIRVVGTSTKLKERGSRA
jgi:hypothetical protein